MWLANEKMNTSKDLILRMSDSIMKPIFYRPILVVFICTPLNHIERRLKDSLYRQRKTNSAVPSSKGWQWPEKKNSPVGRNL